MRQAKSYWVEQGTFLPVAYQSDKGFEHRERRRFESGGVLCSTSQQGTEVHWHAQTPCFASLFAVMDWLQHVPPPFVLSFNISGWFVESHLAASDARQRIEELTQSFDRHFPERTFIETVTPSAATASPFLREVLAAGEAPAERQVLCSANPASGKFSVDRVGNATPIARFYGTSTSTFPCVASSYGAKVSEAYGAVLDTGKPRLDHVLACFRLPDNQQRWIPYHRVILPTGPLRVAVVAELAPVGFKVV